MVGLLGTTMGFFVLDAIAGAVVSFFILFGGYELIKESNKMIHGGDPKLAERDREELKTLFEHRASYLSWLYRKSIYPRKINWIAEGL